MSSKPDEVKPKVLLQVPRARNKVDKFVEPLGAPPRQTVELLDPLPGEDAMQRVRSDAAFLLQHEAHISAGAKIEITPMPKCWELSTDARDLVWRECDMQAIVQKLAPSPIVKGEPTYKVMMLLPPTKYTLRHERLEAEYQQLKEARRLLWFKSIRRYYGKTYTV